MKLTEYSQLMLFSAIEIAIQILISLPPSNARQWMYFMFDFI